MSEKIYVVKDGCVAKSLTTQMCLGTNDEREFPVYESGDNAGKPVKMVANFTKVYKGKWAYITSVAEEIALFTKYLMNTQNPYFYDVDNPTNSRNYYISEELQ